MKIPSYEWVLEMSKGDSIVLTEKQYAYYKENYQESKVFFDSFEINPAFVMSASKKPAYSLYKMYPCKKCNTNGFQGGNVNFQCNTCKGTGLDI